MTVALVLSVSIPADLQQIQVEAWRPAAAACCVLIAALAACSGQTEGEAWALHH